MLLDAPTLAVVAALALGAAVISGIGGFGTGVILAAALAPLIGIKAVIPVLAVLFMEVLILIGGASLLWNSWR